MSLVQSNFSKIIQRTATAVLSACLCCAALAAKTNTAQGIPNHWDACFTASANTYSIDPTLLKKIAWVESRGNPHAVSPVGAMGLMQIDSSWLPKLKTFGISKSDLFDPCTNINVGAWILAHEFQRRGNNWEAVGAYNASCTRLKGNECKSQRAWYSWKVFQAGTGIKHPSTVAQAPKPIANPLQTVRIAEATSSTHE